ncbi:methylated-DNA--[protein]-cysteine S-methyltransferase [bacterium]|nr:methylated-DNA--[protein]-cysteine S-methyltransferase [bacterium]
MKDFSLKIEANNKGITGAWFTKPVSSQKSSPITLKPLKEAKKWLELYKNDQKVPKFPLKYLDISIGTPFQQRVWKGLLTIPHGKVISYADLAKIIRQPKAFRAVGNANGKNPIPVFIPCHRVIASNGTLGGYSSGLPIKKALLKIEKVDEHQF